MQQLTENSRYYGMLGSIRARRKSAHMVPFDRTITPIVGCIEFHEGNNFSQRKQDCVSRSAVGEIWSHPETDLARSCQRTPRAILALGLNQDGTIAALEIRLVRDRHAVVEHTLVVLGAGFFISA